MQMGVGRTRHHTLLGMQALDSGIPTPAMAGTLLLVTADTLPLMVLQGMDTICIAATIIVIDHHMTLVAITVRMHITPKTTLEVAMVRGREVSMTPRDHRTTHRRMNGEGPRLPEWILHLQLHQHLPATQMALLSNV